MRKERKKERNKYIKLIASYYLNMVLMVIFIGVIFEGIGRYIG